MIAGYVIKNSNSSANFRNLYGAIIRLWSKEKRPVEQLWPIPTDFSGKELDMKAIYERNKKILSNGKDS